MSREFPSSPVPELAVLIGLGAAATYLCRKVGTYFDPEVIGAREAARKGDGPIDEPLVEIETQIESPSPQVNRA